MNFFIIKFVNCILCYCVRRLYGLEYSDVTPLGCA